MLLKEVSAFMFITIACLSAEYVESSPDCQPVTDGEFNIMVLSPSLRRTCHYGFHARFVWLTFFSGRGWLAGVCRVDVPVMSHQASERGN